MHFYTSQYKLYCGINLHARRIYLSENEIHFYMNSHFFNLSNQDLTMMQFAGLFMVDTNVYYWYISPHK
jgi:hypothetical protein